MMTNNDNHSQAALLDCIEMNPPTEPKLSIIWLHGLGADGSDFVPVADELQSADLPIRFVFPHAPTRPVTINQGYVMRAWFDIASFQFDQGIDEKGIQQSVKQVQDLIEHELSLGMPAEKIILAGFSQGAVIAILTGLTYPKRLAGIIALSGFVPMANQIMQKISPVNRQIPIFLGHGTEDPIVPFMLGQITHSGLQQAGLAVSWHAYQGMPHSVCEEEIRDIQRWIGSVG